MTPSCAKRWELSNPIDNENTPQVAEESHSLRHSYARHWLQSGLNVNAMSVWLGHSSPTVTLDTYLVLAPDTLGDISQFFNLSDYKSTLLTHKRMFC